MDFEIFVLHRHFFKLFSKVIELSLQSRMLGMTTCFGWCIVGEGDYGSDLS